MSVTLPIEIQAGRLDHAEAELIVAPFFESHRPLRGPAARVDWRLCGLLSDQLAEGRATGTRGEAILLATGGRFRAPKVLAFGMGAKPGFSDRDLRQVGHDFVRRLAALRVGRVALALPDEIMLGFPLEAATFALLRGVSDGLISQPVALHLQLFGGGKVREILAGAERAAALTPDGIDFRISHGSSDRDPLVQRAVATPSQEPRGDTRAPAGIRPPG